MDDHGWADWPDDDPDLGPDPHPQPDLGAADTADLNGLDSLDGDDGLDDDPGGFPDPPDLPGDEIGEPVHPPLHPDDAFSTDHHPEPTAEHVPAPIGYGDLGDHDADLPDADDIGGQDGFGAADPPVGADPDAPTELGEDPPFPPPLDLGTPEPVDGYPWTDPATLGVGVLPDLADAVRAAADPPSPADLIAYAVRQLPAGADAWAVLAASDDPAVSALARWWRPS